MALPGTRSALANVACVLNDRFTLLLSGGSIKVVDSDNDDPQNQLTTDCVSTCYVKNDREASQP